MLCVSSQFCVFNILASRWKMSGGVKQPPRLLEQLLVQPTSSGTPKRNGNAPKRSIQLTVDEHSRDTPMKRKNKDFVDSAVRAITADEGLSDLLNLDVCQCESDPEESLVVITTKLLHYYEPAKHMSRLRLVLSGNGSYYIQVLLIHSG